ncbi:dentin sialophosphoprotein, partial [Carica papaya]|uniref:dentin sialophosphoprotein n=1 Tax=Carica papaya TaxID=3649 RepID=UPI000B8CAD39
KFTWSRELGDLCDIYEEHQSGEDGNGLLVESGCAWRKLNVQRILDESTKNHVKMLSEEAERKTKSRKAIVLDPGNPSMKSQIKQLVVVEANPWRMPFKQKKEPPFKKRKVDPPQVGVLPKSAHKSGLASISMAKVRRAASPLPSPPEQSAAPVSPVGIGNITKSHEIDEESPVKVKSKENAASAEKNAPNRTNRKVGEVSGGKVNLGCKPVDLPNMLITLLKEHPKGMRLKDLEKAVGDVIPNSAKKLEPIIKKIATLQAPGRYCLKPGVELDSFKRFSSESGSSPEDNNRQTPDPEKNHDQVPAQVPSFVEKVPVADSEEHALARPKRGEESNISQKNDIQQDSPDFFGEKKVSDNSDGQAGSSSDSGSSTSESDSSDSGSDSGSHSRSRSRSRSRSLVGSGSGSSSDSDSDASSNSKEGSDEDVDIISDDDKDTKHNLQSTDLGFSTLSPWQTNDDRSFQEERHEGHGSDAIDIEGNGSDAVDIDGHESDAVDIDGLGSDAADIEKDMADNEREIEMAVDTSLVPRKDGTPLEGFKPFTSAQDELQERQNFIGNLFEDIENINSATFRPEQSDSSERASKSKSKRGTDLNQFNDRSRKRKRLKAEKPESLSQPPISGDKDFDFSESGYSLSPNGLIEDTYKCSASQMNRNNREGNANFGTERNQILSGKSSPDLKQSGRRASDQSARAKAPDTGERSDKHSEGSGHGRKGSEKSFHIQEGFPVQKEKASRDAQKEDNSVKEKRISRNQKDASAGGKHAMASDTHQRKHGEMVGKFKEALNFPGLVMGSSPQDNNIMPLDRYPINERSMLQREFSDLELGELREPLPEETLGKKQFERKNSFRNSGNKPSNSENNTSELGKGKTVGKVAFDMGKPSPLNPSVGAKRTPEHHVENLNRSQPVVAQPQHQSRVDNVEVGSHYNKLADASRKSRQNESGMKQGVSLEGYGESHKKAPMNGQHDSKRGLISHSMRENKTNASNPMICLTNGRKNVSLIEGNDGGQKKRESSPDEDSSSYLKYEKDEPELKGPIKDFPQYKEYVQEYHDKYESYFSLNKILESYRNEFQRLGQELEYTKGRDMEKYYKILGQLKESYHQCGERHKKLKKIFLVLHEELKVVQPILPASYYLIADSSHLKQQIKDYALSYAKS